MALHESDREDLLAEATGLPERLVIQIPGIEGDIFIGFRRSGCASLYVDADPVFQFNLSNELRRGFFRGMRLAAEQGELHQLNRNWRGGRVVLERTPLSKTLQEDYLQQWYDYRQKIIEALASNQYRLLGVVPEDQKTSIVEKVTVWLGKIPSQPRIAEVANAAP